MTARVQPFPYAALPAVSRIEREAAARLRAIAERTLRPEAIAAALSELTGEIVTIDVRRTRPLGAGGTATDGVGVALARADEPGLDRAALVDVERTLAASLVSRGLRQRAPRIVDATSPARAELAGALAALVHAVLRRAGAGPLRVVAAGPAPELARDVAAAHGSTLTAWLTVVLGGEAFDARVSVPEALLFDGAPSALTADALAGLGGAPIALPLVVATCLADRLVLASLRPGDVFVAPGAALASTAGRLGGRVALVAPRGERGLAAELGEDGRLVLGSGPLEGHPWDPPPGGAMSEAPNPTLQVVEEAPVVVRVELGSVELTAREWAALAPGDVVALGRKLGDPAVLRVAGVELARGELVQVDGEYGVRILARADGSAR